MAMVSWTRIPPVSTPLSRRKMVPPVRGSPASIARCTGAAPRHLGSRLPCRLTAPNRVAPRTSGGSTTKATTTRRSACRSRKAWAKDGSFTSGTSRTGNANLLAISLTAVGTGFNPRPAMRSGCVPTRTISWEPLANPSRQVAATGGVPRKTTRIYAPAWMMVPDWPSRIRRSDPTPVHPEMTTPATPEATVWAHPRSLGIIPPLATPDSIRPSIAAGSSEAIRFLSASNTPGTSETNTNRVGDQGARQRGGRVVGVHVPRLAVASQAHRAHHGQESARPESFDNFRLHLGDLADLAQRSVFAQRRGEKQPGVHPADPAGLRARCQQKPRPEACSRAPKGSSRPCPWRRRR